MEEREEGQPERWRKAAGMQGDRRVRRKGGVEGRGEERRSPRGANSSFESTSEPQKFKVYSSQSRAAKCRCGRIQHDCALQGIKKKVIKRRFKKLARTD